jgi:hypothetical protein
MSSAGGSASSQEGVIVWFRPEMGSGVVKLRTGRQYRFSDLDGLDLVKTRQIVSVSIVEGQPAQVTVRPTPDGQMRFEEEPAAAAKKKKKATTRAAPKKKRANMSATSKPAPKKKKKTGVAAKLKPLRDGSLPVGVPVLHPQHGQGFVVVSSAKACRVRFMPQEEERSVRVEDLQILDSP